MRIASLNDLTKLKAEVLEKRDESKKVIVVADGTCCRASGSREVYQALVEALEKSGDTDIEIKTTGCHGFCQIEPNLYIKPSGVLYANVKPNQAEKILEAVKNDDVIRKDAYKDAEGNIYPQAVDVPFYQKQQQLLSKMNWEIDPLKIEEYIANDGYQAMAKALLDMESDTIIDEVIKAKLRGRGGGGFETGWKWKFTSQGAGETKYIVCNADEGDPGAYMDRSLLEGNPHLVIEGMIIGAKAIGSSQGYVYVRNEYPQAVQNLTIALEQAREYGLLGENILGSGVSFDIKIVRGGGAFVCGESSALMNSIEGMPGEPVPKYIHMSERGLYDMPTNLNNVETWANIPMIISRGADWFGSIGTENSKGTKIFSLVGKINNTGLVEVPMGTTLRQIIFEIGGGIPDGKAFKAVQTGGPSGGCIPAEHLDTPVDFDKLTELGSMMGSGGMIVMDEETCMIDVAKYFLNFLMDESCGKCTPCREGLQQLHFILNEISEGKAQEGDLEILEELAATMKDTCLCELGKTAANPLMTTIRYFRDEYKAHIEDKKCPAGVCRELITFDIDAEKCTGCMLCKKQCPSDAIAGKKKEAHVLDQKKCIKCGACYDVCKFDAVIKE